MLSKSILVISDQHAPYHHIDTLDFLAAIKKKYKPDTVVNIGDEMDWHSISFHDKHPGLYSPSHELEVAREFFKNLEKLFPNNTSWIVIMVVLYLEKLHDMGYHTKYLHLTIR